MTDVKDDSPLSSKPLQGFSWSVDWNLLRTFMVIAECNGITRAAEQLGLKQPSVSSALRRLEEGLQVQLAERDPRNFVLTAAGEALYAECKQIFGSVSRLPDLFSSLSDEVTGEIRVCLASHVITPLLDETLAEFHQLYPQTRFSVTVRSSSQVVAAVSDKSASFGVCLAHDYGNEVEGTLFYREHFGFFCGPLHPLFGRSNLQLSDLRDYERVSFYTDSANGYLRSVALLRQQANLSEQLAGVSDHLEEVRRMIVAGVGYGPLPIHVVETDIKTGRLWQLPPYTDTPSIDIHLVRNPDAKLNRAEAKFLELLQLRIKQTPLNERTYGASY
ncbi:LysR family transcriptional regulator [Pseudidiomarina marina]|uniref:LysR family transcriptional regulator n=1 Tax=Pseudidiomarina marina TaxID=502366 RepID=UPI00385134D2